MATAKKQTTPPTVNLTADVLILGAGAAGLASAAALARSRRSIMVLEARDRIGGRCYTCCRPRLPLPIELGAEFIHGRSIPIFKLLQKSGKAALDSAGPHWFGSGGHLRLRDNVLQEIRAAIAQPNTLCKKDVSFSKFLTHTLRSRLSIDALAFARTLVESYDGADPDRISALEVVEEWSGGGAADSALFRPLGGYGPLLACLAETLTAAQVRLQLHTVVKTVKWRRGNVEVTGTLLGTPFRARASQAIITLPLGVLQLPHHAPHAVHFFPGLKEKRAALRKLDAGSALKVVLRFRRAFWEELDGRRYRNAAFLHSANAPFPTFWTALPIRAPMLTAWSGGPRARRLSARGPAEIIRLALTSLEAVFGKHSGLRDEFLDASVHDWQRDPYCFGAYSNVTVGGQGARETLALPLRDTLYFAGEATDLSGEAATVGGALQSGIRAARELMRRL